MLIQNQDQNDRHVAYHYRVCCRFNLSISE